MSSKLLRGIEAAEERKAAVLGDDLPNGVFQSPGAFQDRAMLSGFDIDQDELLTMSTNVSMFYHRAAGKVGLQYLFQSAWVDGLLVGLLTASLSDDDGD